jgi:hypothetical protein
MRTEAVRSEGEEGQGNLFRATAVFRSSATAGGEASKAVLMTTPQLLIFLILAGSMGLFLWGRYRHDVVALAALMACVVAGLVPADAAFAGFGHPAVITVAAVLVLSRGLQNTGAVDWLARSVLPRKAGRMTSMMALMGLGAALSGFMNNVGAMALLMPIAVQLSDRLDLAPGQVLMPLAFGTILGGMTTLIGTPPNLIVSGFRAEVGPGISPSSTLLRSVLLLQSSASSLSPPSVGDWCPHASLQPEKALKRVPISRSCMSRKTARRSA